MGQETVWPPAASVKLTIRTSPATNPEVVELEMLVVRAFVHSWIWVLLGNTGVALEAIVVSVTGRGVPQVPSPRQKVEEEAKVPEFNRVTGMLVSARRGFPATPVGLLIVRGEVTVMVRFVVVFNAVLTTNPFPPGSAKLFAPEGTAQVPSARRKLEVPPPEPKTRSEATRGHGAKVVAEPQVPITQWEVCPVMGVRVTLGFTVGLVTDHVSQEGPEPEKD